MEWRNVKPDEDIRYLNNIYESFDDSFIGRMEYISGDFVNSDYVGQMNQCNDLKVIFQRSIRFLTVWEDFDPYIDEQFLIIV